MQVIIVDHRRGWTRRFDATGRRARAIAVASGLALSVLFAAVLVAGWQLHSWLAPKRVEVVDVWGPDVADQRAAIDTLRERLHDESAAFARRIATLQAHVTRLDAAGERMARLAELDDGPVLIIARKRLDQNARTMKIAHYFAERGRSVHISGLTVPKFEHEGIIPKALGTG